MSFYEQKLKEIQEKRKNYASTLNYSEKILTDYDNLITKIEKIIEEKQGEKNGGGDPKRGD